MDALRDYFKPKKVVMAAKFHFHQRQQPGESVAMYLAELRKLAVPCEFGEALDEVLWDRLVCRLCNEASAGRMGTDTGQSAPDFPETANINTRVLRGSKSGIHQLPKGGSCSRPPGQLQEVQLRKSQQAQAQVP